MTKRIYIRGNVGDPRDLGIYDADTGKKLIDVTTIQLVSDVAGVSSAILRRHGNPNISVDVVAGPPAARTGETFHLVTLDADQRASHCDTIHVATVQSLTMNDDGTLDFQGGQVVSMNDAVSDQDLKFAINPRDILAQSADRALISVLGHAISSPLLRKMLLPATGGVVSKPALGPNPFVAPPPKDMFTKPKCPECFDTGLTNGFMHPCSKGCKP
jgi:hypothetical protein